MGKTDVSIELAKRLSARGGSAFGGHAEIVGCDSMQVYRRMPILTQQPTHEQRAEVAHHLIDCVEPTDSFSVGQYRQVALEVIEEILRRGKTVLIAGGTGLYLKALTDGLCDAPPADASIRSRLWQAVRQEGSEVFHRRLQQVDPQAASTFHPRDARRIVRALEVYELTGKPLSSFWNASSAKGGSLPATGSEGQAGASGGDSHTLPMTLVGLTRDRAELYARINHRVERMIREDGVLDEAKHVLALPFSHTARQVHGLAFLEAYLKGERTLADTIRLWQQQVRNYARRQLIWFRAEPRISWFMLGPDEPAESIADRILEILLRNFAGQNFLQSKLTNE